jgi:hypothetical protein
MKYAQKENKGTTTLNSHQYNNNYAYNNFLLYRLPVSEWMYDEGIYWQSVTKNEGEEKRGKIYEHKID